MENVNKKAEFLLRHGLAFEVKKANDVMGTEKIEVTDILNGKKQDSKINRMSDIFPQSQASSNDFLS